MNLAELPVYKVKRVMSEAEATELVGTTVPEAEANCNKEGIWIDEDTEEIIFVYFPMEQEVNLLRAAVLNINYGETIRQSTGLKNKSRTFGMAPRKIFQRRESCRPTTLALEQPSEHAVLIAFAEKFAQLYKEFAPDLYEHDKKNLAEAGLSDEWRMTDDALWTSGVVNKSSTLPYHRDGFNFATWSAMPVIRKNMAGGYLTMPEYNLTCSCRDGWVTFFAGYKYVHGVTPMSPKTTDAYRYSIVYYALRGMKDCFTYAVETAKAKVSRTNREDNMARALKGEIDMPTMGKAKAKKD
jgi:hypothetical protein